MANVSKDARFEAMVSHYKDTFEIHSGTIKDRNRFFLYVLLILAIFIVQLGANSLVEELCNAVMLKTLGATLHIRNYIPVLLWFLLAGITVRYFQLNIQIQQQYSYLHKLEADINGCYPSSVAFTREGFSYLTTYPLFSSWLWGLYNIILPLALLGSIVARIYVDIDSWPPTFPTLSCFIAYEITGTSILLYLLRIHFHR